MVNEPIMGDATPGAQPVGTPAATPDTYPVTVDGVEEQVTIDQMAEMYSKGKHFTQSSQALAEEKRAFASQQQQYDELQEMATGLASRPDIIAEIQKMWPNPPQQQQPQQQPQAPMQPGQPGVPPQGAPPMVNPQMQQYEADNRRMQEMLYEQQVQQEAMELRMTHPDVDIEAIYGIAADNPGVNLETAWKLQQYEQQQVAAAQAAANAGSQTDQSPATGQPPSGRPDVNNMTEVQVDEYVLNQWDGSFE